MSTVYLLGIDIGTTGSKTILIDAGGRVAAETTAPYPMATPRPGWAEQNPDDWWHAVQQSVKQVMETSGLKPSKIAGIGITGQMHGLVLLDAQDLVLRPCIMWNDQRSASQCAQIAARIGIDRLIRITGKPALTGFTAGKILWVKQNEPDTYARIAHIQLPKDYVRYCLTGALYMDASDASGTNLFDTGKRTWSREITQALEISDTWLPEAVESSTVIGCVTDEAARRTGLVPGIPVIAGAGDQGAQAIGTGIAGAGIVSVTIGTSGVIFAATDSYIIDQPGRLHAYCHAVPGKWHLMGVTLAAGGSLRWLRDLLWSAEKTEAEQSGAEVYDLMTETAGRVPAGSEGLVFLPYLSGERTPHPDPDARGVFFGLSLRHARPHLTRAVIEGVTFSLRECLDLLGYVEIKFDRVRISGGGARSSLWRQIMADVFGVEVVEVNIAQGAAYGAALLAGVGTAVFSDAADACDRTIHETTITRPGSDRSIYQKLYERYKGLYPILKDEFEQLAKFTEKG